MLIQALERREEACGGVCDICLGADDNVNGGGGRWLGELAPSTVIGRPSIISLDCILSFEYWVFTNYSFNSFEDANRRRSLFIALMEGSSQVQPKRQLDKILLVGESYVGAFLFHSLKNSNHLFFLVVGKRSLVSAYVNRDKQNPQVVFLLIFNYSLINDCYSRDTTSGLKITPFVLPARMWK